MKKQNEKLSEYERNIQDEWPTNYKNSKHGKVINILKIGHTKLTHGYLMAKEDHI